MSRTRLVSRSIELASRDIRRYVSTANALLAARDRVRAYAYAEAAQMTAFDLKSLIEKGDAGIYTSGQNDPTGIYVSGPKEPEDEA